MNGIDAFRLFGILEADNSQFKMTLRESDQALQETRRQLGRVETEARTVGTQLANSFSTAERKALTLQAAASRLVFQRPQGFERLSEDAARALREARNLQTGLRQVETQLARPQSPRMFETLKQRAVELRGQLREVERDINRIRSIDLQMGFRRPSRSTFARDIAQGMDSRAVLAGLTGGLVGAGAAGTILAVSSAVRALGTEIASAGVKSVKAAADFEMTVNAMRVFTGSTRLARRELEDLAELSRRTPGLSLVEAQTGAARFRGLGFSKELASDLVEGIAKQKLLSGVTDEAAVNRVIVNLTQLSGGSPRVKQDIKEMIQSLPTLRLAIIDTFGSTQKFEDELGINAPKALAKFAEGLKNTQVPTAGLNDATQKLTDSLINTGRVAAEPLLAPLTRDAKGLTDLINSQTGEFRQFGIEIANVYRAASDLGKLFGRSGSESLVDKLKDIGAAAIEGTGGLGFAAVQFLRLANAYGEFSKPLEDRFAERFPEFEPGRLRDDFTLNTGPTDGEILAQKANAERAAEAELTVWRESFTEWTNAMGKAMSERQQARQQMLERGRTADAQAIRSNYSVAEAELKRHLKAMETSEIDSMRRIAALRQSELNDQLASTRRFYEAIIANARPEDVDRFRSDLDAEILQKTNELRVNAIEAASAIEERVRGLKRTLGDLFADLEGQRNPFVRIFAEAERALRNLREQTRGLPADAAAPLIGLQQRASGQSLFEARITSQLEAFDLLRQARVIREAPPNRFSFPDDDRVFESPEFQAFARRRAELDEQFRILRNVLPSAVNDLVLDRTTGEFRPALSIDERSDLRREAADRQRFLDQKIIDIVRGIDPSELTPSQREIAAEAFERQARDRVTQESEAREAVERQRRFIETMERLLGSTGVPVSIKNGQHVVRVIDESDRAEVTSAPSQADVDRLYGG